MNTKCGLGVVRFVKAVGNMFVLSHLFGMVRLCRVKDPLSDPV